MQFKMHMFAYILHIFAYMFAYILRRKGKFSKEELCQSFSMHSNGSITMLWLEFCQHLDKNVHSFVSSENRAWTLYLSSECLYFLI